MIRAYNFNLTFNVSKLYAGVVLTTFVNLVGALDKSIQRQWFISAALMAAMPSAMPVFFIFKTPCVEFDGLYMGNGAGVANPNAPNSYPNPLG